MDFLFYAFGSRSGFWLPVGLEGGPAFFLTNAGFQFSLQVSWPLTDAIPLKQTNIGKAGSSRTGRFIHFVCIKLKVPGY